jgi:anthranilate synthase component 2
MKLTLIDNYDSFTYNLLHYFAELGAEVDVVRNDALSADEVLAKKAQGIVLSPGPSHPDNAGISLELVQKAAAQQLPLFGVCLGHQTIGQAFGGKVVRTPPMHGKTSAITHDNSPLFAGIPSPFTVTRYHSLIVEKETLPDCLHASAFTQDGIIMALHHKTLPVFGVQFHPESIASEYGHAVLQNFMQLAS